MTDPIVPPLPAAPTVSYQLVTSDAELASFCIRWEAESAIALDTEFMRVSTFYPEVGLVQVADSSGIVLIDPLSIKDWAPFKSLMQNPGVTKVLHSCSEDLLVFITFLGGLPTPLFDTQIAAALAGDGHSLSYQNLVKQRFGVEVPKTETRSDWLQRPLTKEQLDYAALDVAYLLECWRAQRTLLNKLGRQEWLKEECTRMSDNYRSEFTADFSDYYLTFKNAWQLRPRSLLALKKLCEWREHRARKRNRPRSWILKDTALFTIANSLIQNKAQLLAVEEVTENFVRHEGDEVIAIVKQAANALEAECPPRQQQPLSNAQKQLLKRMQDLVDQKAEVLGVPPEMLGRKRVLIPLLQAAVSTPSGGELPFSELPSELLGWRRHEILEPLLVLLQS